MKNPEAACQMHRQRSGSNRVYCLKFTRQAGIEIWPAALICKSDQNAGSQLSELEISPVFDAN